MDADHLSTLQHRLLSLELSLRSASMRGLIAERDFAPRRQLVQALAHKLQRVSEQPGAYRPDTGEAPPVDGPLPDLGACSRREKELCLFYLKEQLRIMRTMFAQVTKVEAASRRACLQGLSWYQLGAFSMLRRALTRAETFALKSKQSEAVAAERCRATIEVHREFLPTRIPPGRAGLSLIFHRYGERYREIGRLRLLVAKKKAELNWIDSWLGIQRYRTTRPRAAHTGGEGSA